MTHDMLPAPVHDLVYMGGSCNLYQKSSCDYKVIGEIAMVAPPAHNA